MSFSFLHRKDRSKTCPRLIFYFRMTKYFLLKPKMHMHNVATWKKKPSRLFTNQNAADVIHKNDQIGMTRQVSLIKDASFLNEDTVLLPFYWWWEAEDDKRPPPAGHFSIRESSCSWSEASCWGGGTKYIWLRLSKYQIKLQRKKMIINSSHHNKFHSRECQKKLNFTF